MKQKRRGVPQREGTRDPDQATEPCLQTPCSLGTHPVFWPIRTILLTTSFLTQRETLLSRGDHSLAAFELLSFAAPAAQGSQLTSSINQKQQWVILFLESIDNKTDMQATTKGGETTDELHIHLVVVVLLILLLLVVRVTIDRVLVLPRVSCRLCVPLVPALRRPQGLHPLHLPYHITSNRRCERLSSMRILHRLKAAGEGHDSTGKSALHVTSPPSVSLPTDLHGGEVLSAQVDAADLVAERVLRLVLHLLLLQPAESKRNPSGPAPPHRESHNRQETSPESRPPALDETNPRGMGKQCRQCPCPVPDGLPAGSLPEVVAGQAVPPRRQRERGPHRAQLHVRQLRPQRKGGAAVRMKGPETHGTLAD
jgi:hypothetical protein